MKFTVRIPEHLIANRPPGESEEDCIRRLMVEQALELREVESDDVSEPGESDDS